jgi:hypothetical protein
LPFANRTVKDLTRLSQLGFGRPVGKAQRGCENVVKRRRRRKESLIKGLFSSRFETPCVVFCRNEVFLSGLRRAQRAKSLPRKPLNAVFIKNHIF